MRRFCSIAGCLVVFLTLVAGCSTSATARGKRIFDGKTLAGWSSPGMSYFSVEDGAITGTTTKAHNPERNQFIVWQGGEVEDFDLTFKFRIFGPQSNSGMQFRSQVREHGLVYGYQADMDGQGKYIGGIWDEYGTRNSLAGRGERVVIDESGRRTAVRFAKSEEVLRGLKTDQWNEYRIRAVGPKVSLWINGELTAELEDRETGKASGHGVLAMPIIPGEPMKVQYRDMWLRKL